MSAKPQNPDPLFSQLASDPEMGELISLFVDELPRRMDCVMDAWRRQEAAALRRLAHQLKGSSAGYGFPTIGDAAGRLENSIDTHAGLEQMATQVADLVDLCKRARAGSGRIAA